MRRKDRQLTEARAIDAVLNDADTCHLALMDGDRPYAVALNYGWERGDAEKLTLYFHCAKEGKKLDLVDANANAAFVIDTGHELVTGDRPCDWSMNYRSVAGNGRIRRARDGAERAKALSLLMSHYAGNAAFAAMGDFDPKELGPTEALVLECAEVTGKQRK